MTKNEARKLLEQHKETDEDTNDSWGLIVLDFVGTDSDGYVFQCVAEGTSKDDYDVIPEYAVYSDGTILVLPF